MRWTCPTNTFDHAPHLLLRRNHSLTLDSMQLLGPPQSRIYAGSLNGLPCHSLSTYISEEAISSENMAAQRGDAGSRPGS